MALGLSHSLSRYKLKFFSEKVDTMVVQAIGLLDELDKGIEHVRDASARVVRVALSGVDEDYFG